MSVQEIRFSSLFLDKIRSKNTFNYEFKEILRKLIFFS